MASAWSAGRRLISSAATAAVALTPGAAVYAHDGPPYPVVSQQRAGPYVVSLWVDPDVTDDGSPAGEFWIGIEAADRAAALPEATRATVSLTSKDGTGLGLTGTAAPVERDASLQLLTLAIPREGAYAVRVAIGGPLGTTALDAEIDATYDLRPSPLAAAIYVVPFVLVGALWFKVLKDRRHKPHA